MSRVVREAEVAAEAIRSLNHATLNPELVEASDVYEALGSLSALVARLPQALGQLDGAVSHRAMTNTLRVDCRAPTSEGIHRGIHQAVADAINFLSAAQRCVDVAHQAASHIWFARSACPDCHRIGADCACGDGFGGDR